MDVISKSSLTRLLKLPSTRFSEAIVMTADWPCASLELCESGVTRRPKKLIHWQMRRDWWSKEPQIRKVAKSNDRVVSCLLRGSKNERPGTAHCNIAAV